MRVRLIALLALLFAAGCGHAEAEILLPEPASGTPSPDARDAFETLLPAAAQRQALCGRGGADPVSVAFCAQPAPKVEGLAQLQALLGIGFKPGVETNGSGGNPAFTLCGHSTSLVMKAITPINPRALVFTPSIGKCDSPASCEALQTANPKLVAMGFARGEQFVELVSRDPRNKELVFFLLRFEQACNAAPGGCSLAQLLTPEVEKGWTSVALYQDVDLRNTVLDCLHCHQPGGPGTQKILRMQELQKPWTHFFKDEVKDATESGKQLLADYQLAHAATEAYAGIPGALIPKADASKLEDLVVEEGALAQPNEFVPQVETEVTASADGSSPTWLKLYAAAVDGAQIAVPYRKIRISDPAKLSAAASAYRAVLAGSQPASAILDTRETFLPEVLPDISLRPKAGASGQAILKQMCQRCHNSRQDTSLTKARFNVEKLDQLSAMEKELAIARLTVPESSLLKMPPPRFGALSAEEISKVVDVLRR